VNVSPRSSYAVAHPSVICMYVCLSVTFVRRTQPVEIFGNVSMPFGTLIKDHPLTSTENFTEMVVGEPLLRRGGGKRKRLAKYSDFGPIEGYISETVQDRR